MRWSGERSGGRAVPISARIASSSRSVASLAIKNVVFSENPGGISAFSSQPSLT
jgi:hypothetical protein